MPGALMHIIFTNARIISLLGRDMIAQNGEDRLSPTNCKENGSMLSFPKEPNEEQHKYRREERKQEHPC